MSLLDKYTLLMITKLELISRWREEDAKEINLALAKGKAFDSPFGVVDGRVDLRGFVLKQFINGRTIQACDFTHASKADFGQIGMSTILDCVFLDAELQTNLGEVFVNCVFDRAKLNNALMRGRFQDCTFRKANMTSAWGSCVVFQSCVFDGANMRKVQFLHSQFDRCSFQDVKSTSGSLSHSTFIGGHPIESQLGTTLMEGCVFRDE